MQRLRIKVAWVDINKTVIYFNLFFPLKLSQDIYDVSMSFRPLVSNKKKTPRYPKGAK